ncbi:MAG: hypothetical protein AAGU11_07765 [Syntrophobacteraceae bacterium]
MDATYYLYLGAAVIALAAAFYFIRPRTKDERKQIPETYFGAVRVTNQQGKDMLIVRKDDGSFEMVEEEKVRR